LSVGRLFGAPIEVHVSSPPFFGFVVCLLATDLFPRAVPRLPAEGYWLAGLATTAVVFAGLLAHELGHVIAARSRGVEVGRVRFSLVGAWTELDDEEGTVGEELITAGAGPAVSLVLAAVFACGWLIAGRASGLLGVGIIYVALCNLMIALFNLLPGLPLDGGRLVRAALWGLLDDRVRATRWTGGLGRGVGAACALGGLAVGWQGSVASGVWLGAIGLFLFGSASWLTIHS
jgi:Zn-dependent protease